jgi:GGDEF domain-containing protein
MSELATTQIFGWALSSVLLTMLVLNAIARPIIADIKGRSSIAQLIDRLLAAFADDFELDGHRLRKALSIGVAIYPADGTDTKR